jgi:hypothetical protein
MSHCPHCNLNTFEIEDVEVSGMKFVFVRCSGCRAPVGVLAADSIGLTSVLRVLVSSLQKLNSRLERIEQACHQVPDAGRSAKDGG